MTEHFDVIIVGGGIAGASCAATMADGLRVLLLEREAQCGGHSSGRSAAVYTELYGNAIIRDLTSRSRTDLFALPAPDDAPFVKPRGILFIGGEGRREVLTDLSRTVSPETARFVELAETLSLFPALNPDNLAGAVFEPGAADVDVDRLLHYYLARARSGHGQVRTGVDVHAATASSSGWRLSTSAGDFTAPALVNAAGAWADQFAILAGVEPIGIQPYRRTAVLVDLPAGVDATSWPCVIDVDEQFYFKPFGGQLMVSPADQTACDAHDVQPEELDIAIAVDRLQTATNISVNRISGKWAGLRSFAPDRTPVVGFDPTAPGFFWLAGQGGYGIQTAPALAKIASALLRGQAEPVFGEQLSPARFRGLVRDTSDVGV